MRGWDGSWSLSACLLHQICGHQSSSRPWPGRGCGGRPPRNPSRRSDVHDDQIRSQLGGEGDGLGSVGRRATTAKPALGIGAGSFRLMWTVHAVSCSAIRRRVLMHCTPPALPNAPSSSPHAISKAAYCGRSKEFLATSRRARLRAPRSRCRTAGSLIAFWANPPAGYQPGQPVPGAATPLPTRVASDRPGGSWPRPPAADKSSYWGRITRPRPARSTARAERPDARRCSRSRTGYRLTETTRVGPRV